MKQQIRKFKLIVKNFLINLHDFSRDIKYCNYIHVNDTQEKLLSLLVISTHTIEKGLTMPEKKPGFGEQKMAEIINLCKEYIEKGYDINQKRFIETIGIIKEYYNFQCQYKGDKILNGTLLTAIKGFIDKFKSIPPLEQIDTTKRDYFKDKLSSFKDFSLSRHSIRNFAGSIKSETLQKAIDLAMNAPSTCNRQSSRVHIIQSKNLIKDLLSIQSGNRGFGHLAEAFLLITSDLNDWPAQHQRNAPFVDGGIFLMNLLYSLHFYEIGACTLNLYLFPEKEEILKKKLSIPNNEILIGLIAIGDVPEKFSIARSMRRNSEEITKLH